MNKIRIKFVSHETFKSQTNHIQDMDLLKIIVCPECKGELEKKKNMLVCIGCSAKYPIIDGIPSFVKKQ